jgi:hypothetical protein
MYEKTRAISAGRSIHGIRVGCKFTGRDGPGDL